ncbi:cytoplasmic tRNA 2-thiolation protein 2-like [Castanea sativa]|uniref:cytoplasmic tRNA 2-thiolation protein 2-like n=1 Tax=Castanea sativa TaxID=21020 RepID=UPI003F650D9D
MFCIECFRSNLYGKFRLAVTSHAMITPTDNVLVAFSDGPSSRVALQFVHELQHKSLKNFDASRDRSLLVFRVGVAFIDETTISPLPSHDIDRAIQDIRLIVSNLAPPIKQLHVVPIENIYSGDGTNRLKNLLDAVSDTTGKEDLLLHLQMSSLQKGQGYSLPADIQYVDSRWEIPIVLPLRDCLVQELNMLCHLDGFDSLKTVELLKGPCSGINGLVSSLVRIVQGKLIGRLASFDWLKSMILVVFITAERIYGSVKATPPKKIHPESAQMSEQLENLLHFISTGFRRAMTLSSLWQPEGVKRDNLKPNESISSESFCPICNSPLNKSYMLRLSNLGSCQTNSDSFGTACCSSCRFQILPKDPSSIDHFYSLLPQPLVARAKRSSYDNLSFLREQIQDCLLSDSEDES